MEEDLNIKQLSYESAMTKLEKICDDLQSGKLDLEAAVNAFELGTQLRRHARSKLVAAKLKVEIVGEESNHAQLSDTLKELLSSLGDAVYDNYINQDLEAIQKSIDSYREKVTAMFLTRPEAAKRE